MVYVGVAEKGPVWVSVYVCLRCDGADGYDHLDRLGGNGHDRRRILPGMLRWIGIERSNGVMD